MAIKSKHGAGGEYSPDWRPSPQDLPPPPPPPPTASPPPEEGLSGSARPARRVVHKPQRREKPIPKSFPALESIHTSMVNIQISPLSFWFCPALRLESPVLVTHDTPETVRGFQTANASCLGWSNGKFSVTSRLSYSPAFPSEFKEKYSALAVHDDRILAVSWKSPGKIRMAMIWNPISSTECINILKLPSHDLSALDFLPPAPPATTPPAAAPTTITPRLGNLLPWRSDHAGPPVVDVLFTQGRQRNAAAGAPGRGDSLIRDEDHYGPSLPDPNLQRQQEVDTRQHVDGWSCCCC
ncbi:uncharacterized protein F5891DRAFT_1196188 [Suillus fuscotomentosus]|uniref:Uncharacterized protein n=1 Tax=Suillus fuscotomentosus TaxID=1912939 RepID=A0AAD4HET9_9AGAM|nr:uncharacterized protein F5891DRAFT_1196188 [Suillus fuscotomentosus]KAG1893561.1 hypothetical protein F5891DRAFT_1196188 [Suillus fuscotomentosus]